jgi:hypothetical protein
VRSDDAIRIDGINRLVKGLRTIERDIPKQLRVRLNLAIEDLAGEIRRRVTRRTGRAASTVRARSTQRAARIVAGGRKAPYYPWLDFGGRVGRKHAVRRSFYSDGRYIFPTLRQRRPAIIANLEQAIGDTVTAAGLETT